MQVKIFCVHRFSMVARDLLTISTHARQPNWRLQNTRSTQLCPMLLRLALLFLVSSLFAFGANVATMNATEAAERLTVGDAVLIDVRESNEWASTGVAEPAVLLAMSDLRGRREQWKPFLEKNRDKTLLLICRSGNRSSQVAALLAKEGFKTVNVGAFSAWKSAGLPVRKP